MIEYFTCIIIINFVQQHMKIMHTHTHTEKEGEWVELMCFIKLHNTRDDLIAC